MYKIVVIPDIHGRDTWKKLVEREIDADKFIFMGDYFDHRTIPATNQCINFTDIIAFKRQNLEKVELLVGNHDLPYIMEKDLGYSGYQQQGRKLIEPLFADNKQYLRVAYRHNDLLFTHAGVSEVWLNDVFGRNYIDTSTVAGKRMTYNNVQTLEMDLNKLLFKVPGVFEFFGDNPYGDDKTQGPLWIRPQSLMRASKTLRKEFNIIQVIAHTPCKSIAKYMRYTNGKYILCDALYDINAEYLVIENNIPYSKSLHSEYSY